MGEYEFHGECAEGFEGVREAFQKNFEQDLEIGASFSAWHEGRCVVDLWGGFADGAKSRPWERDTLVNVYSTTKAMAALSTLMLVDRGVVDLDAPVARYWPEFAAAGKEGVLVRHLLSHTSGVPGWEEPITVDDLYDWERSTSLLAAQAPWWEPGTVSGYHALNHGHLLGEVVRRADGRTLGTFYREEVAEPLGVDFHIGLAPEHLPRCGELVAPEVSSLEGQGAPEPGSVAARVLQNPPIVGEVGNRPEWKAAEIPAANGQGNARAVAKVAGALAAGGSLEGVKLLGADTLAAIHQEQCFEKDLVLAMPLRWGLGFGITSESFPVGPNPRTFFWGGWGGSLVVVDLDARLGFAYVMNKMGATTMGDTRGFGPAMATYAAVQGGS